VDGDGQFPIKYLSNFLYNLDQGSDLVLAVRRNLDQNLKRRLGSQVFLQMCRIFLGVKERDVNAGFRGMNKKFAKSLVGIHSGKTLNPLLYVEARRKNFKISWVDIITEKRLGGSSFIHWDKPIILFIDALIELLKIRLRLYHFKFRKE
jgi:hypothetical protein